MIDGNKNGGTTAAASHRRSIIISGIPALPGILNQLS